jgi:hypothetical protein
MILLETSSILCTFPTRRTKILAPTNVRKVEWPRPPLVTFLLEKDSVEVTPLELPLWFQVGQGKNPTVSALIRGV